MSATTTFTATDRPIKQLRPVKHGVVFGGTMTTAGAGSVAAAAAMIRDAFAALSAAAAARRSARGSKSSHTTGVLNAGGGAAGGGVAGGADGAGGGTGAGAAGGGAAGGVGGAGGGPVSSTSIPMGGLSSGSPTAARISSMIMIFVRLCLPPDAGDTGRPVRRMAGAMVSRRPMEGSSAATAARISWYDMGVAVATTPEAVGVAGMAGYAVPAEGERGKGDLRLISVCMA